MLARGGRSCPAARVWSPGRCSAAAAGRRRRVAAPAIARPLAPD